jgi:hypothetical protein
MRRRRILLKLMVVGVALSMPVAEMAETNLGRGSSKGVKCPWRDPGLNARGNLPAESVETSVTGVLLNNGLCREQGAESVQPGRLSAHDNGRSCRRWMPSNGTRSGPSGRNRGRMCDQPLLAPESEDETLTRV